MLKKKNALYLLTVVPVAAMMAGTLLSGCADDTIPESTRPAYTQEVQESQESKDADRADAHSANIQIKDDPVPTSGPAVKAPEEGSLEYVARLGRFTATEETDFDKCMVDARESYALEWHYGSMYDRFVDKLDWSLVFDVEYYKDAFPMLAILYHDDEDALLRHFQTVGIHEGRQASERFNVAAYMENCSNEVRNAFEENYASYYLWYMQSYATEKSVAHTGKSYPQQLCLKLSAYQQQELDKVNEYRELYDAEPLVPDGEMMAYANYRAYVNLTEDYYAHGWLHDPAKKPAVDACLDAVGAYRLGENCCDGYNYNGPRMMRNPFRLYAGSTAHAEAMRSEKYAYFGCSDSYIGTKGYDTPVKEGDTICTQFDTFADKVDTAMNPAE